MFDPLLHSTSDDVNVVIEYNRVNIDLPFNEYNIYIFLE